MRILFFGDGQWATDSLKRLVQEEGTMVGVVARVNSTDAELASTTTQLRLPYFQPEKVNSPDFVARVAALRPDLNLSISYDQILRLPILETAPLGFINFHAGKLPNYRGRNVINWAIINGETEIGLTAHYVDLGIDTGDIILQQTLPIGWADTYGEVLEKVIGAFPDMVSKTVSLISSGQAGRQPQAHLPGTYFAAREKGDEWLDWQDTSLHLYNKIRAITRPGPGARTVLGHQTAVIWRAGYEPGWPCYLATPGQVVGRRPGQGILVKTGDSTLLVQEVQVGDQEPDVPNWHIGARLGINLQDHLQQLEARFARLEKSDLQLSK